MKKTRRVKLCKEKGCRDKSTTMGYCRVHYLKNWKQIKAKQKKKAVESLNKYIDHIMKSNPDGYVDAIREDLKNQEQFSKKVDGYFYDDDYVDTVDEMGSSDISKVLGALKVDDNY